MANSKWQIAPSRWFFYFIFFLFAISNWLFASSALAAFEWEVPLPPAPGGATLDETSLDSLFTYIYNFGLGLGGFFAFIRLIIAGIKWGSEGAGIPQKSAALDDIKNTIFGLLLLLFSWVILNTINPQILNLNLQISKAETNQTESSQGLAGVFDSLTRSAQRKSLDEVLQNVSKQYLVQSKSVETRLIPDPQLSYFWSIAKITPMPVTGPCLSGDKRSLNQAGIICYESLSSTFNCDTPLSCDLINDLLDLQLYFEPIALTGSSYGSHQEQRAVDLLLYDSDPNNLDPRDQFMMEFLNSKKDQCGDELFAPAKFGDLCYFMSNNQATSTCDFYPDQIHYSVLKNCQK
ncbi:MAG: pilin [Patescibacteria group bacterium]